MLIGLHLISPLHKPLPYINFTWLASLYFLQFSQMSDRSQRHSSTYLYLQSLSLNLAVSKSIGCKMIDGQSSRPSLSQSTDFKKGSLYLQRQRESKILYRVVFSCSPSLVRFSSMRSIYWNDYNQQQSDFITNSMRNLQETSLIPSDEFQHRISKPLMTKKPSLSGKAQQCEENELYQLCQQLTRENRHLKREVSDLRKMVVAKQEVSFEFCSQEQEHINYRQLNYDCYKKKAIHLLTSLKFLHKLYVQKCSIDKRNKILQSFMGKIRQGNINHIDELLRLYDQSLNGREDDAWNIDELQRQSSEYQNNILRNHIKKLNIILLENVNSLKNNLNSIKVDIVANNEKTSKQIQYCCQRYIQNGEETKKHTRQATQNHKKKKTKQSIIDENQIHKESWEKITNQRAKIRVNNLQQNVKEKIHQSLMLVESQQRNTIPISNFSSAKPYVPKPQSRSKKQSITIIDQLKSSKALGTSSLTPSNDPNKSSHFRNNRKSSIKKSSEIPSCKKSQNNSPKKNHSYYR